jgi:uncharacterized protein with PIN domain
MKSWREDKRFHCPDCGKTILLRDVDSIPNDTDEEVITNISLIAVCTGCKRSFLAEQWHRRHGIFDPYWDVDF